LSIVTLQLGHLRIGWLGAGGNEEADKEKKFPDRFHISTWFSISCPVRRGWFFAVHGRTIYVFSFLDYKSHVLTGEDTIRKELLRMPFDFGQKGVVMVGIVMS
jgi:hypothetical protein